MAKPSDVYTGDEVKYLNENQKRELSTSGRTFSVLEINDGIEGEYGKCWELKLGFQDTGEILYILMGESARRNEKFTAWQTFLMANEGEDIGPCIYLRGKMKNGQTWSDIRDA